MSEQIIMGIVWAVFVVGAGLTFWGALTVFMLMFTLTFGHTAPYKNAREEIHGRIRRGVPRLLLGLFILALFIVVARMSAP